jgi:hypothetical protein
MALLALILDLLDHRGYRIGEIREPANIHPDHGNGLAQRAWCDVAIRQDRGVRPREQQHGTIAVHQDLCVRSIVLPTFSIAIRESKHRLELAHLRILPTHARTSAGSLTSIHPI